MPVLDPAAETPTSPSQASKNTSRSACLTLVEKRLPRLRRTVFDMLQSSASQIVKMTRGSTAEPSLTELGLYAC